MRALVGGGGMDFANHLGLSGVVARSGELIPLGPAHEYLVGGRVFTGYMALPHVLIALMSRAVGLFAAFKLHAVLTFAVAGTGAVMLARRLAMPPSAALLAALYVSCAYPYTKTLILAGEIPHLAAYALVPAFIALVIDACRAPPGAARPVIAAGLALAAVIVCHPTVATRGAFAMLFVLAALGAAHGFTRRGLGEGGPRTIAIRAAAVCTIALALTAWRLVPTLEYFDQMGLAMNRTAPADGAITDFFLRSPRLRFWTATPATLVRPYLGVTMAAVVLLALARRRRWAAGLGGATGAVLALLWAAFHLKARVLGGLLPFSGMDAQAPRFPNYMVIGVGLLFGAAAHAAKPRRVRRRRWMLAMAALVVLDVWSLRYGLTHFWPKFQGGPYHEGLARMAELELPSGRQLHVHSMNLKLSAPAFVPRALANAAFPDLAPPGLAAHAVWLQAALAHVQPIDLASHLDVLGVDTVFVYKDSPEDAAPFDAALARMAGLGWTRALVGPRPDWTPPHRTDRGTYVVFTRPDAPAFAVRAWECPAAFRTGRSREEVDGDFFSKCSQKAIAPGAALAFVVGGAQVETLPWPPAGTASPSPVPVRVEARERLVIEAPPGGFRAPLRLSLAFDPWWRATDETGRWMPCRHAHSGFLGLDPRPGVRAITLTWTPPPSMRLMIGIAVATLGLVSLVAIGLRRPRARCWKG